jgi:hypothetical protein
MPTVTTTSPKKPKKKAPQQRLLDPATAADAALAALLIPDTGKPLGRRYCPKLSFATV